MLRRSTRFQRTRPMRPKPRLFAPNARSVRPASSTPWLTASVRAYGEGRPSGNAGVSSGSGASQPDFFGVPCVAAVLTAVVGVVVVGAPSVHGTGFHGSGWVFV